MKNFPFIDITDLPTDRNGSLGKLRTDLIRAYNFNRQAPKKLQLLEETLLHVVKQINSGLENLKKEALEEKENKESQPNPTVYDTKWLAKTKLNSTKVAKAATTKRAAVRTPKQDK